MFRLAADGVMVEVYNDVALRRCPITRSEAQAMIAEVKGARLLQGFRGRPAADLAALTDTLVRVSHLGMHLEGQLAELDINPLMVLPSGQGVKAVDALVVLRGAQPSNLSWNPAMMALMVCFGASDELAPSLPGSYTRWSGQAGLGLGVTIGGEKTSR